LEEEPEEDDEDPEEDPADYPADGDDDDYEEEEEEHPAPADSIPPIHRITARISIRDEPSISLPPREEVKRLLALTTPPPSPLTLLLTPSPNMALHSVVMGQQAVISQLQEADRKSQVMTLEMLQEDY
ncbi:hypothetical protein Tco_0405838, partial [Tanacetum coccineum]